MTCNLIFGVCCTTKKTLVISAVMSYTLFPDYCSAAICNKAKKKLSY